MVGKLIRVEIATRHRERDRLVPTALGGGGGIWGWGGSPTAPARLALRGHRQRLRRWLEHAAPHFDEAAGYGEHLVELTPGPARARREPSRDDPIARGLRLLGSPVVFTPPAAPRWSQRRTRTGGSSSGAAPRSRQGPYVDFAVQPTTQEQPLLTQMAYDPRTRSLFVLTAYALVRVAVDDCKTAHVVWKARMPVATLHGSPTVAGSTVWITRGRLAVVAARLRHDDGAAALRPRRRRCSRSYRRRSSAAACSRAHSTPSPSRRREPRERRPPSAARRRTRAGATSGTAGSAASAVSTQRRRGQDVAPDLRLAGAARARADRPTVE